MAIGKRDVQIVIFFIICFMISVALCITWSVTVSESKIHDSNISDSHSDTWVLSRLQVDDKDVYKHELRMASIMGCSRYLILSQDSVTFDILGKHVVGIFDSATSKVTFDFSNDVPEQFRNLSDCVLSIDNDVLQLSHNNIVATFEPIRESEMTYNDGLVSKLF